MDRMIQMVVRMVVQRLVNMGIQKGVHAATRKSNTQHDQQAKGLPDVQKSMRFMRRFLR